MSSTALEYADSLWVPVRNLDVLVDAAQSDSLLDRDQWRTISNLLLKLYGRGVPGGHGSLSPHRQEELALSVLRELYDFGKRQLGEPPNRREQIPVLEAQCVHQLGVLLRSIDPFSWRDVYRALEERLTRRVREFSAKFSAEAIARWAQARQLNLKWNAAKDEHEALVDEVEPIQKNIKRFVECITEVDTCEVEFDGLLRRAKTDTAASASSASIASDDSVESNYDYETKAGDLRQDADVLRKEYEQAPRQSAQFKDAFDSFWKLHQRRLDKGVRRHDRRLIKEVEDDLAELEYLFRPAGSPEPKSKFRRAAAWTVGAAIRTLDALALDSLEHPRRATVSRRTALRYNLSSAV